MTNQTNNINQINQTNQINQINHTNHINNTNHINQTNHTNHINKTAIITGASRGIGAAIAKKLASCGYNLSLCCRNSSDRLKALADELHCAYGIEVLCYTGNVGDFFFAKDMVTKTISHFGHIDVLINNAGISHIGLLSDMTPEEWNNIVAINLTGVFNFTKLVIPYMVADKCGRILQISSVWGNVGSILRGGILSLQGRYKCIYQGTRQGACAIAYSGKCYSLRCHRYRYEPLL